MKRSTRSFASLILCSAVLACRSDSDRAHVRDGSKSASSHGLFHDDDDDGDEHEANLALTDIPANVRAAALAAVPGFVIEEAELESFDHGKVYSLEGHANGEEVEVEVSPDGKVIEIEPGDDDEGDDD
jgi:uncharacterized membrane protein YkoI